MQEVVITPKTLCSFFPLWRPKLYLGHIKSNSPSVTGRYVNGSGNSLKHCSGGQKVGANNNKVFTSFEWFRTTWSDHFNRLQCAGTDFQVPYSFSLHFSSDVTRSTWQKDKTKCPTGVPPFRCPAFLKSSCPPRFKDLICSRPTISQEAGSKGHFEQ